MVVVLLMSVLAALYLGSMLSPKDHLHRFPIAIVNSDDGDQLPDGSEERRNLGAEITARLVASTDRQKIDLHETGISTAMSDLSTGKIYGAIVIPSDFTKRAAILAQSSVIPGDVERPQITVYTNPRASTMGAGLVESYTDQALGTVTTEVGAMLTATVEQSLGATAAASELSGATRLTLADPIDVRTLAHDPLPDHTGQGLSAFYYTLLLLLAGFTGAMIVNAVVDGALGFAPTEFGPWFVHRQDPAISRLNTLVLKWGIMVVLAPTVSALYLAIATALKMPVDRPAALWLYGAFAIVAIGVTALSISAAFGTLGLLINLLIFIVLALPSSGGAIPLEATPRLYAWLATFEPMHQVYLGVRAILYLNGFGESGLERSLWMTFVGLLVGLALGSVSYFYDRKGLDRRRSSID
ncbi:YhgE/Pip domain-containing protein [Nocardia farcinica]